MTDDCFDKCPNCTSDMQRHKKKVSCANCGYAYDLKNLGKDTPLKPSKCIIKNKDNDFVEIHYEYEDINEKETGVLLRFKYTLDLDKKFNLKHNKVIKYKQVEELDRLLQIKRILDREEE